MHSITNSWLIPGGLSLSKDKDRIHYGCESHEQDPYEIDFDASHLSWYKQTVEKRHQDTVYSVHIKTCSTERIYFLSNTIERYHSVFMKLFQLVVSRKLLWRNLEKSCTRKDICHLNFFQRYHLKIIGWKNCIQKLLKTPNKFNQNQKRNFQERRNL